MRWILTVRYEFDASHFLPILKDPAGICMGTGGRWSLRLRLRSLIKAGLG